MSDVITVRLDRRTKEKIKKFDINISEAVRRALEEEIRRHETEELTRKLKEMKRILKKIPDKELVRVVRETRDRR
ncbi:MAG: hypothetical protein FJ358_02310 [Thaumarchaeota archaeon]|nr:hypothetical protein [Nitrososphaerota archaeon]